ncbi:MAG: Rrf2 family transcriptional regulator [Planctomycetaceae bacterium]|nr:Rrf2 family transcriptional regulator [Planctomycetaceae bacterium]
MKLSRTVEYAVQAMLQLAQHDKGTPVPCSKLAASGQMPERFLLQILRNLVTHGILSSTRGVDGGYVLERPVEQITLLDVIEAIDGPLNTSPTPAKGMPEETHRRLSEALQDVTTITRRELSNIKLAALLPPPVRM